MIAADTSLAVAAFAPWHESHAVARHALGRTPHLPAHCGLETFATLTRLPDPFRVAPGVAAAYLARRFRDRWLDPEASAVRDLAGVLAPLGIVGGATYDALVAVTAKAHNATLRTLDRRAERVYRLLDVDFEVIAS